MKRTGFKPRAKPFSAKTRKPMSGKSAKRTAHHASQEGKDGLAYMMAVKTLPCVVCGIEPSEAHHCRCRPPYDERSIYQRMPSNLKSGPRDTIPLCTKCHRGANGYHTSPATWRERNGPDYRFIASTRAKINAMGVI